MASFFGLHNLYLQLIVNTWRAEGKVEASVSKGGWDLSIQIYILFAFLVHIVFLQKHICVNKLKPTFSILRVHLTLKIGYMRWKFKVGEGQSKAVSTISKKHPFWWALH